MNICVISLRDSLARQARVSVEMAKTSFAWRFVEAVDGRTLDLNSVAYDGDKVHRLLGFELTPKEIGCYLSHIAAWRSCIDTGKPTLVFEDDFIIEPHFEEVVNTLLKKYSNWEIVRLQGLCESACREVKRFENFQLVQNDSDPLGATAYMVNPVSAKRLLDASSCIFEPLDHYIEHHQKHGLTMMAIKPYPVTVADPTRQTSTITDRPDRLPLRGARKLKRSMYRLLDRLTSAEPWFPN